MILTVTDEYSGERIDSFIAEETELSRSAAQKHIENGDVTVNGSTVSKKYLIREGDEISEKPLWMSNGGKELVEVKLGDGVCEVADYLHKLKAIGYDGGISIETVYDGYGASDSERDIAFVKKYFA